MVRSHSHALRCPRRRRFLAALARRCLSLPAAGLHIASATLSSPGIGSASFSHLGLLARGIVLSHSVVPCLTCRYSETVPGLVEHCATRGVWYRRPHIRIRSVSLIDPLRPRWRHALLPNSPIGPSPRDRLYVAHVTLFIVYLNEEPALLSTCVWVRTFL